MAARGAVGGLGLTEAIRLCDLTGKVGLLCALAGAWPLTHQQDGRVWSLFGMRRIKAGAL